jgi:5-methylcytosine-specific restriction endonuclease McrA
VRSVASKKRVYTEAQRQRRREASRDYRQRHPDRVRVRQAERRATPAAREKHRLEAAVYRRKHPARVRASKRKYAQAHRAEENARHKSWRDRNAERRRAVCRRASAMWRAAHPDQVVTDRAARLDWQREYGVKWRAANRDRMRELVRAWALANPERLKESGRRWRATPHGKRCMAAARDRRRARVANAVGQYTAQDVLVCLLQQGGRCFYCVRPLTSGFHVEHMTPLARGGSNGPENIVCACPTCNLSKGTKTAAEFILG